MDNPGHVGTVPLHQTGLGARASGIFKIPKFNANIDNYGSLTEAK